MFRRITVADPDGFFTATDRDETLGPNKPFRDLDAKQRKTALEGGRGFEGILRGLERRANEYARRKIAEGADEERLRWFPLPGELV